MRTLVGSQGFPRLREYFPHLFIVVPFRRRCVCVYSVGRSILGTAWYRQRRPGTRLTRYTRSVRYSFRKIHTRSGVEKMSKRSPLVFRLDARRTHASVPCAWCCWGELFFIFVIIFGGTFIFFFFGRGIMFVCLFVCLFERSHRLQTLNFYLPTWKHTIVVLICTLQVFKA